MTTDHSYLDPRWCVWWGWSRGVGECTVTLAQTSVGWRRYASVGSGMRSTNRFIHSLRVPFVSRATELRPVTICGDCSGQFSHLLAGHVKPNPSSVCASAHVRATSQPRLFTV